ncbi:MAG: hypothetical protein AAF559_07020 [Pseudomonadota bacterium]
MNSLSILRRSLLAGVGPFALVSLGSAALAAPFEERVAAREDATVPQTAPDEGATSSPQEDQADDTDFGADSGGGPGGEFAQGEGGGQIVVEGTRLRGQLDVEQAPILELSEADIAAEGVASIADLVQQIQNQTGSARGRGGGGRPVILVNGIRPGSFRELFQYPPEALAKVEVFPEEVAQRFGFPPDRRVVNLILKEDYASREVELEFEGPARGGRFVNEQEFGYLQIADGGRINFNFTANDASLLTEDERNIIQTPGSTSELDSDPGQAEFRSLRADFRSLEANLSWAKAYIDSGLSVSANANYQRSDSRSINGLNIVTLSDASGESLTRTFGEETPLTQTRAEDFAQVSGSLSKRVNAFRLTSTFNGGYSELEQIIDRRFDTSELEQAALDGTLAIDGELPSALDSGFDTANTRAINATNLNTLRGPVAELPGGEVLATFDIGYEWSNVEASDTRGTLPVDLTRGDLTTGANLVIPITSRRNGFADALGSFTLNTQVGLQELSDFGTLGDYNVSLNWSPIDSLDLSATYVFREVAPGLRQLGDPQVVQPNVPVFDFVNGETVLAEVKSGGNPDLIAQTQKDWKFAANWELPFADGLRFTVEYIRNRSEDVTSGFPQVTQQIEAAFPDRITRDQFGTLIAIDRRAVNFAETRADRLQFRLSARGGIGQGSRGGRGGFQGGPPGAGGRPSARPGGEPSGRPSGPANGPSTGAPGAGGPPNAPQAAQAGAPAQAGAGAGGPPAGNRRAGFMALRERVCADDGLEFLKRLIAARQNGEDVSAIAPGLPPQMIERIIARAGSADGEVTDEQLGMVRTRLCSMEPGQMRRGGGAAREPGQMAAGGGLPTASQGGAGRPAGPPSNSEQMAAMQARLCGEGGLAEMRKLVAMIERGEDVSAIVPGMDPSFLKFGLERMRAENNGTVPDAALESIRGRICAAGGNVGANIAGNSGGPGAPSTGGRPAGGPPRAAFNPLARGQGGWRYFANLTHTIELQNEILIAQGVDVLDQLDGDATGAFGFPRHSSRLEAGLFGNGVGLRLSGRYTGETRLDGADTGGSGDLFFDDLATLDLRIFGNVDQLTGSQSPALKNLRISLRMDNIFDGQRAVRDANGNTPINYQPFVIDPIGRFVGIDIRKLF